MRLLAFVPILLSIVAIVLGFLCIFAGHKRDFMESYDLMTLNISRIGQGTDLFTSEDDSAEEDDDDGTGIDFIDDIGDDIDDAADEAADELGDAANDLVDSVADSLAQQVGLEDFYSVHILNYCEGTYVPGPVPNATLDDDDIDKNVTMCSKSTSMFTFDPTEALERSINDSRVGQEASEILDRLEWPEALEDGITALHVAFEAMFVFYCIGLGFSFLCLLTSIAGVFMGSGRLLPALNVGLFGLAFLTLAIASAISTAISEKATDVVNEYGNPIGVSANVGHKFMAITWAAAASMFVGSIVWCVGCILPGRRKKHVAKHG